MLRLTAEDRATYLYLRAKGILEDEEARKVPLDAGTTVVCCADGDQFFDLYGNLSEMCLQQKAWPRTHPLTSHGGALVIPPDSILNIRYRGDNLVEDIIEAWEMKRTKVVTLYAHAPCGAATKAGLSLAENLDLLVRAKLHLKEKLTRAQAQTKVACFVHIDRGVDEGKRTYFISAAKWQLLTRHNPVQHGVPWPPQLAKAAS